MRVALGHDTNETPVRVHRQAAVGPTFTSHAIAWPAPPAWIEHALCPQVDSGDIFFPPAGSSASVAKQICRACPVQAACLAYAMAHREKDGVWGGLTPREREAVRRNAKARA